MSETKNKKNSFITSVYEWVEVFCFALFTVVLLFTFVLRLITVDGSSMNDTFVHGDRVVISDLFYTPKPGDVVVVQDSTSLDMSEPIIKRIIATEGETVDIDPDTWTVTVTDKNGNKRILDEQYARRVYTITVPLSWDRILEIDTDQYSGCITDADGYVIGKNVAVEKIDENNLLIRADNTTVKLNIETLNAKLSDSNGNTREIDSDLIKKQLMKMRLPSVGEMFYYHNAIAPTAYPHTVKDGHVFVMGDNRNNSLDSRLLGDVDERMIIGKAYARVLPNPRIGF